MKASPAQDRTSAPVQASLGAEATRWRPSGEKREATRVLSVFDGGVRLIATVGRLITFRPVLNPGFGRAEMLVGVVDM